MTEEEYLNQIDLRLAASQLIYPQFREEGPAYYEYAFVASFGRYDYRFPVSIPGDTPDDQKDEVAKSALKEIVALLAKKVAAW